ncbi:MAG: YegP family protein [Maribacter sp.]|nr:YegP family protein [Maribacter sp.]
MIEIKKEGKHTYKFELKSQGGHTLLKSVEFSSKDEVKEIVKYLGSLNESEVIFERKTNHEGKFLFNLKSPTGVLIGQSLLYDSEAGMENGIKYLKNRITFLNALEKL